MGWGAHAYKKRELTREGEKGNRLPNTKGGEHGGVSRGNNNKEAFPERKIVKSTGEGRGGEESARIQEEGARTAQSTSFGAAVSRLPSFLTSCRLRQCQVLSWHVIGWPKC